MRHSSNFPGPTFLTMVRALLATLALLAMSVAGFAQETTSGVRGTISGPDGSPAAGAMVTVVDQRTGTSRSAVTSNTGQFSLSGLRVGGPYTIGIQSSEYAPQSITDVYLGLGDTFTFDLALGEAAVEEIVVTATALRTVQVALGPSATFTLADLEDAPAINRNINDVITIDPRIYVDESFNDSIQCAGANSRFNALTVDGVRLNDNFGLNSNGYPTERMPFPYDAIEQVSVELAPFDVQYGGFTACNINAVTKSGQNEFHGSIFYDYTDDSLTGDKLEGDPIDQGSFDETRFGLSIGGPILQDKLFFFAAYEKLEGANIFPRGPADSSAAVPVLGVTQAQLDRIRQIAQDVYDYDIGNVPASLPNEDEKYLIKLDWEINDNHRAAYTYTYNDGFNINESDDAANQFEFSNHYYERGAELTSNVVQLFSNWNENFSSEFRVSYSELDNRQLSLGGTDFGEVQIRTFNDPDGAGPISSQIATVFIGGDDSRQSNKLKYDTTNYKLAGTYSLGDHQITGGWEREEYDIFNLFIQHTTGEYRFDSGPGCAAATPDGCIDLFESGDPDDLFYGNAPSLNPIDGAGDFGYQINTVYLQDEFPVGDSGVTVVAGVRYDWYTSSDLPSENANFIARNGYSNASNFDGEGLIQPRLGFNWDINDTLSIRGGAGLYSGGNPNVWLTNSYQNDGQTTIQAVDFDWHGADPDSLLNVPTSGDGRPLYNAPQSLVDFVAAGGGNSGVNALAPGFDIPKEWKFALGATWDFDAGFMGSGYRLMLDYLHTEKEDSALIINATLEQVGTAPDGRPIYHPIDRADPDCVVPQSPLCSDRSFNEDFILSNVQGNDGDSDVYSLALAKSYDWGLDWTFGYAYTESTEVSPMTSSVAFSNYANMSLADPNSPGADNSNYNIPHRFTLRLNYRHAFFGDNLTKFTLFGRANEGRPYSPVFVDAGSGFGDSVDDRHLLYIPTGPSDPNVTFGPGFDTDAFFAYINSSGLGRYAGGIAPRNSLDSNWWQKFDVKIEQEFPGFSPEHHFAAFVLIENVGNLINDDWGVMKQVDFPHNQQLVDIDDAALQNTGAYIFQSFQSPAPQSRVADASLWEIRFGISYDF
ncbi:MAG TPA: TonB-dependent receptor [Woeseiaceae bacterium]|nr:TonB-dependent receptor [Woeseiaceae bacterium]